MGEEKKITAERLAAFSDAVFAVIVTIMVLELEAPQEPTFSALVSLLPFATAWVARTQLASSPVVLYAGLFVCIDIAYNAFERHVLAGANEAEVSSRTRRFARRRSLVVLGGFAAAMLVALVVPRVGFGLICAALILHVRPEVPDFAKR